MITMELKQYLNIIKRRILLVILIPIILGSVAAYLSYNVMTPQYRSYTTLYVINKNMSSQLPVQYSELMTGSALVKDYRELVKSKLITTAVIEELGLKGISASHLAGMIDVSLKNDTRIIQISVSDTNPTRAKNIANKIAEVFKSKVVELMKADNVEIIDYAQQPKAPYSPNHYNNIGIALIVGIILGIGMAFLLEYFDDRIRTAEDVEKRLELTVLATIPVFSLK